MTDFIELTEYKGEKVLISVRHVVKLRPDDKGTIIYLDIATGNEGSASLECVYVEETYALVKRKLSE